MAFMIEARSRFWNCTESMGLSLAVSTPEVAARLEKRRDRELLLRHRAGE
jgi:hypothetical protein